MSMNPQHCTANIRTYLVHVTLARRTVAATVCSAIGDQGGSCDADGVVARNATPLPYRQGGGVDNTFVAVRGGHVCQLSNNCSPPSLPRDPLIGTVQGVSAQLVTSQNTSNVIDPLPSRSHIWCSVDLFLFTAKDQCELAPFSWVIGGVLLQLHVSGLREEQEERL